MKDEDFANKEELYIMDEDLLKKVSRQLDVVMDMLAKKNQPGQPVKRGRPTKEHIVVGYRKRNPDAHKMKCAREARLSIKTVSKYWNSHMEE